MLTKVRKYFVSASFIGIVLGVVSVYYTLRGTRTHLSMDIAAESNVLDVRHPIPGLSILFQGRDIEEEKSNLKVLTIRVINDGEANIRESDFDSRTPFGLQVDGGRLIRAQVAGSNSSYLSENLHPRVESPSRVLLDKIIFDKGKFVAVEVLVLHPKSGNPAIRPMGKIAGLEEIAVTNSFHDREQRSFTDQVFSGPFAIQISRTIAYFIGALLTIAVIGFSIAGIASIRSSLKRRKRRRIADRLPKMDLPEREEKRKVIETIFVEYGPQGLRRLQRLLGDESVLRKEIAVRGGFYGGGVAYLSGDELATMRDRATMAIPGGLDLLWSAKLVNLADDQLKVDPELKPILADFIDQVNGGGDSTVEP